ncbi:MAG: copper resistance protein CopC, partial [Chloroflexota bacterium]
ERQPTHLQQQRQKREPQDSHWYGSVAGLALSPAPIDRRVGYASRRPARPSVHMPVCRLFSTALFVAALAGPVGAACAPTFAASPHLVAAWPPDEARLPIAPHVLDLTFNRPLSPESTWAEVWRYEDGSQLPTDAVVQPSNPRRLTVRLLQPAAGQYRLHWHAVAARTAAPAEGEQDFSLADESNGAARIGVSQATADSGDRLEVKGNGFSKRSTVTLTIGDDAQALNTVETDAHGTFGVDVRVPPGVPFGVQPVSAIDSNGEAAVTPLQVRWGGWPPLVAFTIGQPGPSRGEVTFAVNVRNRSDYLLERVRLVLEDPDPNVASFVAAEPTPQRQQRAVVWEIPVLDRGVAGPFRATYRTTAAVATHARIEFRHRHQRGCAGDDCPPAFVSETTSDSTAVNPAD